MTFEEVKKLKLCEYCHKTLDNISDMYTLLFTIDNKLFISYASNIHTKCLKLKCLYNCIHLDQILFEIIPIDNNFKLEDPYNYYKLTYNHLKPFLKVLSLKPDYNVVFSETNENRKIKEDNIKIIKITKEIKDISFSTVRKQERVNYKVLYKFDEIYSIDEMRSILKMKPIKNDDEK